MIRSDLGEMRTLFPILNEIDDDCLSRLDCSEWFRPDVAQAARIDAAAKRLGVYLMPYRAGGSDAVGKGLCRLVVAAKLDAGGVDEDPWFGSGLSRYRCCRV